MHLVENDAVRFGAFNYPPAEIWPYRLVEQVSGAAGVGLLTGTWLALNVAAFAVLAVATRRSLGWRIIAFFPFLVLWELQTNVATTMVVVAGIVAVHLAERRAPRAWHRPVMWLLMGVGLLTKFVVVPLYAVWWLFRVRALMDHQVVASRGTAVTNALRSSVLDLVAPLAVAVTLGLPFGIHNVLRETVLFNLRLGDRDELTTFYPNVLSGTLEWVGVSWLYPALAVAALAVSVLTALRMDPIASMFIVTIVFLLVAPTPEPQYTPVVVMLLVALIAVRQPVVPAVQLDTRCDPRRHPHSGGPLGGGARMRADENGPREASVLTWLLPNPRCGISPTSTSSPRSTGPTCAARSRPTSIRNRAPAGPTTTPSGWPPLTPMGAPT